MYVSRLGTKNFRNLKDCEVFPCRDVNVIYGKNAQGKTNLLEAFWFFTGGHSFRGVRDSEIPKIEENGANSSFAALSLDFFSEDREQKAVLNFENGKRSSVINGVKKNTGSALVGKVCAVIFSPDHLLLVKEGPGRRRALIDGALCQRKPKYAAVLTAYNRTLSQRNALLKDAEKYPELSDTLEVWDIRLSELGAAVMCERAKYARELLEKASAVYEGISRGNELLNIEYEPGIKEFSEYLSLSQISEIFLRELVKNRRSDMKSGFTSRGPHRDDLGISLNGVSARTYASQGQQRSIVLSLKLGEAEILSNSTGEAPIVLLDDVMSELDGDRQDYLLNHLHSKQVFITCCSPETVDMMKTGRRFRVSGGEIFQEDIST